MHSNERHPVVRRSIGIRNPYVDPMNAIQVELLRRFRGGDDSARLPLMRSIAGMAAQLRDCRRHDLRLAAMPLGPAALRRLQISDRLNQREGFTPVGIVGRSVTVLPVTDNLRDDLLLLHDRGDDVITAHSICSADTRDIVQIEIGDRRGDHFTATIEHGMMHEGERQPAQHGFSASGSA